MKIALAQLNYHIGNFENNVSKIQVAIAQAKAQHVDLIVFAELAVCGYPPRDFLEFNDFITQCEESVHAIAKHCIGIAAIVGAPSPNTNSKGKKLFNSAYFLCNGKIEAITHKTLLPNYDIFDEYRYFEPNTEFNVVSYKGVKIALTICEDIWDIEKNIITNQASSGNMYTVSPLDELKKHNPDLIINISASPYSCYHADERKIVLTRNAKKYHLPVLYVNHVGSQTELIFDGGSMVVDAKGEVVEESNYFEEDVRTYTIRTGKICEIESNINTDVITKNKSKISSIHDALVLGIRDYFNKMGFSKAIVGLSGGIDSAVTLVLAERALGKENIKAVLMPSPFSSEHSVEDARQLSETLNCAYDIIPIETVYNSFNDLLHPLFKDMPFNITEENIQARIRAVLLMAISNKLGYILLNTSNKSEAAVGYGTLYGDMCGGLSVLGDVYKTDVYLLANYINNVNIIIPKNTITKPPSAELRPDQKDADSLPDYEVLDKILYQYIELQISPKEIVAKGFDEGLVKRIMQMVNTNEYKRYQAPPILRVSSKAFGMGRRMPIVGKYL